MHLQENTVLSFDLGVKDTQDVAQYPLHHVTYAPTNFEFATSKVGGVDAFTRKYSSDFYHEMLPSTLYIM